MIDRRGLLVGGLTSTLVGPARGAEPPALILEAAPLGRGAAGVPDPGWAFNGVVPGPLLRLKKGDELRVQLVNKLSQPTSLCWQGVRAPNAMDGVAGLTQAPVAPGASFTYRFVPPDSGTFWYHPVAWPFTAEQVRRGLFGVLIVDEPQPPTVDADLLLMLDDRLFDGADHGSSGGKTGSSTPGASLFSVEQRKALAALTARPGSRIRLRIVNACTEQLCLVRLPDCRATVIAIDGQPSELFEPARNTVPLGPGARADLILDLPSKAAAGAIELLDAGGRGRMLVPVSYAGPGAASRGTVSKLSENPLLPTRIALEKASRHTIEISELSTPTAVPNGPPAKWAFNGRASDGHSGQPLFTVPRGAVVVLTLTNKTQTIQSIHLHGFVFRVLHDLDDGWDPYWRDSLPIAPGKTKHIAFIADAPGKWALASAMLERQVSGLAAFFVVGENAGSHQRSRATNK